MKCLILAGGFARRMWPMTMDFPKSLLPVAGRPVIEHIIERIEDIPGIDEISISTNKRFEDLFRKWMDKQGKYPKRKLRLIVEPAMKEEEKFGCVKAIQYFIKQHKVDEDLLVIGGDNIFSFDPMGFVGMAEDKKAPIVAFFDIGDIEEAKKFGVCALDEDSRIKEFQEKPEEPKSTLVSTCIYHFNKPSLRMFSRYLADKNNPDNPGFFISWLSQKTPVYGFVSKEKWYDIGSQETYKKADRELRGSKSI